LFCRTRPRSPNCDAVDVLVALLEEAAVVVVGVAAVAAVAAVGVVAAVQSAAEVVSFPIVRSVALQAARGAELRFVISADAPLLVAAAGV
jgi:hypothetical protein